MVTCGLWKGRLTIYTGHVCVYFLFLFERVCTYGTCSCIHSGPSSAGSDPCWPTEMDGREQEWQRERALGGDREAHTACGENHTLIDWINKIMRGKCDQKKKCEEVWRTREGSRCRGKWGVGGAIRMERCQWRVRETGMNRWSGPALFECTVDLWACVLQCVTADTEYKPLWPADGLNLFFGGFGVRKNKTRVHSASLRGAAVMDWRFTEVVEETSSVLAVRNIRHTKWIVDYVTAALWGMWPKLGFRVGWSLTVVLDWSGNIF